MQQLKRKIDRGSILAAIVVATFDREPKPERVEIEDLSKSLARLIRERVIDLSDFTISPGGEYSEDVSRFIGNHLLSGYAETRSPLVFFPKGLERCRSKVLEAYQNKEKTGELSKIARALDIDLSYLQKKQEH